MKAVSAQSHFVTTGADRLTTNGANGRQAWGWGILASRFDLNECASLLSTNANAGFNTPPARFLLQKLEHNLKFSNVGQANTRLCIYHCRAKRDIYTSMNYVSPNGVNTYAWSTIEDAVQQGIAASSGEAVTGGVKYLIPGVDHTESPIFNSYFKVLKTTEVLLAVGGTHKITTRCVYDKVLDASVYANEELNDVLGVTDFLLYKAEGQTGVIEATDFITIAPTQIAMTYNFDYTFSRVEQAQNLNYIIDPISAEGATPTVISASTGSGVTATGLIA